MHSLAFQFPSLFDRSNYHRGTALDSIRGPRGTLAAQSFRILPAQVRPIPPLSRLRLSLLLPHPPSEVPLLISAFPLHFLFRSAKYSQDGTTPKETHQYAATLKAELREKWFGPPRPSGSQLPPLKPRILGPVSCALQLPFPKIQNPLSWV